MLRRLITATLLSLGLASAAQAEMELSVYSGFQTAPHSGISGNDPGGVGVFDVNAKWEGKSFAMPPYYGIRATWWKTENFGYGVEFNHAKVYADAATRAATGFSRLEFTDGLNIITMNAFYRWPNAAGKLTPYVGAGIGIAVPHVDIESVGGKTFEYQFTGPAMQLVAGMKYDLNDRWALFGEYKGTYSMNKADLASGGTLETNIVTNAINLGVSYKF
ncbi:MAG: outer membrane protein [Brevirhabdus sp.]